MFSLEYSIVYFYYTYTSLSMFMSLNKKDFVLVKNMRDTFVETPYLGTQKNE